jgi:serine/threonine-protein kinase
VKRLVGTTFIAAAVALGLLTLRTAIGERAKAEAMVRADTDQQAALTQTEQRSIERRAQVAANLPALTAALTAHVDSATIVDLLDSEEWWQPFRAEFPLVRVIIGDTVIATRGTTASPNVEAEVVKSARHQMVASARATVGAEPYLLGAARLSNAPDGEPVIVLGRPTRPIATPAVVQKASDPTLNIQWAAAGAVGLIGVGLMFSRGARSGRAQSMPLTDSAVVEIAHETTLKFGDKREPENDVLHPFDAIDDPPAPVAPRSQVVIVAPPADAQLMFGRYRLVERLSEGGMSELFIAKAAGVEGFTRSFVLKRLRPELARDKDAVAQFIDEARLQADLVHSNVVPVFDFGVVGGEYFMTQEYIRGRDVGQLMDRRRERGHAGLPTQVAYYLAHETLQALAFAHGRTSPDGRPLGIVHRDVAAGNVLVSLAAEVKLSDFGIVKSNDRVSRTQVGIVKGNANFMAPEQARGQAVDPRSDLYSLGLVLFYCLSGELLYDGQNDLEVLHHAAGGLRLDDVARIRQLPDPAPQILERALAADPNDRYQTATEFIDAVAVHMGGGRTGLAQLMRDLFAKDLEHQTALPAAAAVGYTAGP